MQSDDSSAGSRDMEESSSYPTGRFVCLFVCLSSAPGREWNFRSVITPSIRMVMVGRIKNVIFNVMIVKGGNDNDDDGNAADV